MFKTKKGRGCSNGGKQASLIRGIEDARLAELLCIASTAAAQRRWNAFSLALQDISAYKQYLVQRRQRRPLTRRPSGVMGADDRGLPTKGDVAARREARAAAREAAKAKAGTEAEEPGRRLAV